MVLHPELTLCWGNSLPARSSPGPPRAISAAGMGLHFSPTALRCAGFLQLGVMAGLVRPPSQARVPASRGTARNALPSPTLPAAPGGRIGARSQRAASGAATGFPHSGLC